MDKKFLFCEVAGVKYRIEYKYSYTENKFKDYLISPEDIEKSDEIIQISYSDKDFEKWSNQYERERTDGYIEYTCIVDQVALGLPDLGMFLMHGATIEYNGKAYVFTAPSGTGKSTHISLWKKYLGEKVNIINGDKPEVSFHEDEVLVHGAPWCGKEGWQINTCAPLGGVCILKRGTDNRIEKINPGEHIEMLINQLYVVSKNDLLIKVVDLFTKMAERVSFFELECDISEDAARCSFEKLTGEDWESSKDEN